LSREEAIEAVVTSIGPDSFIVATAGMIGRELYAIRARRGERTCTDFLSVGAMGHASSVAAGLALARPETRVICLDGDGGLLMHLGSVAVNGGMTIPNLVHVVLNNASHDSVGGAPTVAGSIDLCSVATAAGYAVAERASSARAIERFFTSHAER